MRAKHLIAVAWAFALLSSGCLRLMDRPEEEGAEGTTCYLNSDCKGGACLLGGGFEGTCSGAGSCESHAQCGPQEACMSGRCQGVQCKSSSSAACGNYDCNDDTFTCKASCAGDFDCSGANVCRSGSCVSSSCTAANAAIVCQGYSCDTVRSECRNRDSTSPCSTVGCATGYTCAGKYRCFKSCSVAAGDGQCGNYRCESVIYDNDSPKELCATKCVLPSDCLNGTVCVGSTCTKQ